MPYLYATALVLMLVTQANSADQNYCRPYAAKLTQTFINYVWKRAYTACLNVEGGDPVPPNNWLTAWHIVAPEADLKYISPIIDATPKAALAKAADPPPGSVPATDDPTPPKKTRAVKLAAVDPTPDPVDPPPARKVKRTRTASASGDFSQDKSAGAPQALCTKHNMRTVYSGTHWNCRK